MYNVKLNIVDHTATGLIAGNWKPGGHVIFDSQLSRDKIMPTE